MAKPRVFISSTFYDLKQIRLELDRFIESLGYEPVRNEVGDIPYGKDDELQTYCYKEIANVDILISIIGSRFWSKGNNDEYSVSQLELKTALNEDKQVFIFIDKNVFTEYETYKLNKSNPDIKYKYVDDTRIYKFIDEISALKNNNNIKGFETAEEITNYLREQFAGLFKQFITDSKKLKEALVIKDLESTAKTLKELVDYLNKENKDKNTEISQIIRVNHPIVNALKKALNISYNIYIEGVNDLHNLMKTYGYKCTEDDAQKSNWVKEVLNQQGKVLYKIFISPQLFDNNGKLKYFNVSEWNDAYVNKTEEIKNSQIDDDDLPF